MGLLREKRVHVVHFECHTEWILSEARWNTLQSAVEFLTDFGYDSYLLSSEAMFMLSGAFWDDAYEPTKWTRGHGPAGGHANCLAVSSGWTGADVFHQILRRSNPRWDVLTPFARSWVLSQAAAESKLAKANPDLPAALAGRLSE